MPRRVIILGSTGSIGTQTLEVIAHLNALHQRGEVADSFEVVGLAAGRNEKLLRVQAERFNVPNIAIAGDPTMWETDDCICEGVSVRGNGKVELGGPTAAKLLVSEVECDLVVAAMVGSAGLPATLAAINLGRDIALANKETLVAAGALIVPAARKSGSRLLPVDSEHSALWQCLGSKGDAPPLTCGADVQRAVLTASGGPFRTWTKAQIAAATLEQALKHPTWSMGKKVTIDSASLMNKALEIIEAHWLFGLPAAKIQALIHPQSLVHAMAEFTDGSTIAQLGAPDMKSPIQHALTWPRRAGACARRLDWSALSRLDFEPVDPERFPAVSLAYQAIERGGTSGAILNAANEAAVAAFLKGRIGFGRISELVHFALESIHAKPLQALEDCIDTEQETRQVVEHLIDNR
jgi:1-deoxy-D-xylulose-5-phosphate reductoisomerase